MDEDNKVGVSCEMIVVDNGRVLLGKRGNVFGTGSWAFPGGHLKHNEKVKDCVKREIKEEVGILPKKMKLLGVVSDLLSDKEQKRHYIRFVFVISKFKGVVENLEPDKCESWEWFDIENLPKPIFVGHVKPLELFLTKEKEVSKVGFIEK